MKRLLLYSLCVAAVSCAPILSAPSTPRNPRRASPAVAEVTAPRRSAYTAVSGLVRADTVQRPRSKETFAFALYSRVPRSRTTAPVHALVVNHRYWGDWVFWTSGRLGNRSLTFSTIDLRVLTCSPKDGCGHDEGFMLAIPDVALRAGRGGFDVRLYSRTRRERILRVSRAMIAEQLRIVDSLRATPAR